MSQVHAYESLIDTIYRCGVGLADWTRLCREIHGMHPDIGVVIHIHEGRGARNAGVVQSGFDIEAENAYLQHYVGHNPWLPGLDLQPVGVLRHTEDICPLDELLRSEFWNDWLAPQGDFAAGSSVILTRQFERLAFVGINYTHRHDRSRREGDRMLRAIGPHLQRAFSLWCHSSAASERSATMEATLNAVSLPVAVVDSQRRLRFANDPALELFNRRDGLSLGAKGRLRAADRAADEKILKAVAQLLQPNALGTSLVIVPKLAGTCGKHRNYVLVPLAISVRGKLSGFNELSRRPGPLVAFAIHDPDETPRLAPSSLMESYGLTPTEAELAVAVLQGKTLGEYARQREISRHTVRNQLSSVLGKTGTNRQADLVRLLTRVAIAA